MHEPGGGDLAEALRLVCTHEGRPPVRALGETRSASNDFEQYWAFHEKREWWRNHAVRYRGNTPPKTARPVPKRHLQVVT